MSQRFTEKNQRNAEMMNTNDLTSIIIGCAINVHRVLGPGLLESAYEECLAFEFKEAGLQFDRQKPVPVVFKEIKLECGYRIDILVENKIVIELKSVDQLAPIHDAQILTYLKFSNKNTGLLINFNVTLLKNGIKRYLL